MYLAGLCRKNSIMDNALVPDQATDWSISLKPGSYTGDTKLQGNSAEFTFAKSSGIVTKDREKDWPIVDRRDPSNNPRNNRGSNFFSNKIPFSFLKRRITQLKTALFSWVKGERLLCAFYPHFRRQLWVRNWKFFSALRASVWSKNKVGAAPTPPPALRASPNMFPWFLEVAEWRGVRSLKPIATLDLSYHWLE